MSYTVKEIYFTMQGEGVHTGRSAVFLRFAGCNLWDGIEEHRAGAVCRFCDTDFFGTDGVRGGKYASADAVADVVREVWDESTSPGVSDRNARFVVCTGGEPALQLDDVLVARLKQRGFYVAIETNGTVPTAEGIDWVCVSPKAEADIIVRTGNELKLVYPQEGALPDRYVGLGFEYFLLQPMDGPDIEINTRRALEFCRANPRWRLSLQTHKLLGIP